MQWKVGTVVRTSPSPGTQGVKPMTRILHGKVRGKTIELEEDLGVVEGQKVE